MKTPRQTKKRSAPSQALAESPVPMDEAADTREERTPGASFPIVGVGASAGGLEAFTQLLKALPLDTGMGFVLVQHLDPEHESALTQILARATSLPVQEVTNNQAVEANHVYIIPPDTNLSIAKGVLHLLPRPKVRTPHRPIDSFFESLSQDQRERAIGVVLSGTASDGTLGLEAIKAEGGITFAQDDSAKYDSMPRSAVGAGCVDLVLSPADMAKELARIAKHPYVAGQPFDLTARAEEDRAEATKHEDDDTPLPSGGRGTPPTQSKQVHAESDGEGAAAKGTSVALDGFRKIVLLLRSHSGVDFSLYKSNTIQRRITRRLVLSNLETLEDYAGFLRGNVKELDALYSDVLISVTSFFRNPEMFDVLQREVFPKLLKQPGDQPIRVWVLGCSTGQEAYSIAMTFLESAEKVSRLRKLQVFATDLNDTLLDKARNGLYAKSLADDITPERLRRFFIEEQGGYRVCKMLREMVVFARQNLIADTPFSRMDLVSCRNLLIYLEPSLQKKAMPTFHFALKPGGFLLLGASESIGGFTDLFEPVDKKYKIYCKKPASPLAIQLPVRGERDEYGEPSRRPLLPLHQPGVSEPPEGFRGEHNNVQREADRITISQFAPPGVVVNAELQVLQFRGPTGAYLEPPIGKASLDLLKMAREGLMLPLHSAINEAKKENRAARKENVRIAQDGKTRTVSLEVIPLKNLSESCFLILFNDAEKAGGTALATQATQASRRASAPGLVDDAAESGGLRPPARQRIGARKKTGARQESALLDEANRRIADLETDLSETREYLQFIQEQHEAGNEELQAASEEVQSSNEELQSINEELETSKEEMESANEELTTVNEEMSHRNVELDRVNNDLINLQTSTKLAIVLLGPDLTIRRFSTQAEKQFDLLAADVGRPISHIRHHLVFADAEKSPVDLEELCAAVFSDLREQEREVRDNADRWHLLRVRPYITLDNKVDGTVLVLVEIEALKRSEQIAIVARSYAENTLETVREPMLVLDHDLRVESANRSFYRAFRVAPAETVGTFVYELGNRQWNIPRLRELLHETLSVDQSVEDFEVKHHFEQLGHRIMLLNARRIINPLQNSERILLAIEDVTDRKQAERALLARTDELETLLDTLPGFVWISRDAECRVIVGNRTANEFVGVESGTNVSQSVVATGEAPYLCQLKEDGTEYRVDELPLQRAMATGLPVRDAVLDFHFRDGRRAHVVGDAVPLFDEQGRIRGGLAVFVDITERKRAEEARHEMERDYRALAAASSEIAYRMSADWSTMLPLDGREVLASSDCPLTDWGWVDRYLPRDEHARVRQTVSDAIAGKILFEMEHRVLRLDGSVGWVHSRSVPILDENEEVIAWFGVASDITARKQGEERLRLAIAGADLGTWHWDIRTGRLEWSERCLKIFGFPPRTAMSYEKFLGALHPKDRARAEYAVQRSIQDGSEYRIEFRNVWPDGSVHWAVSLGRAYYDDAGEPTRMEGIALDITERKLAEEMLYESERDYRALAVASSEIAYRMSADWSTLLPLDGRELVTSSEQPLGDWTWLDQNIPPDEHPRVRQAISEAIARKTLFELEHRVRRPDGSVGWTFSRAMPILDENEEVIAWFGAASDITDRKRDETLLKDSEARYRRLFESAKDGILILDANTGRILDANPCMTELSGYSTVEFIGKELWEIGLFCDQPANEAAFRELQQMGYVRYDHLPLKSKSGQPAEVEFVSNVYQWDHRQVAQCNIRDISDRSCLEKQTKQHASELSDLHRRKDEFLAMLSHELRSPLAPIANAVQLLGLQEGSENEVQQQARGIIGRQLSQLQHLVDDLLEVSRITTGRVQLRRKRVALSDIVGHAVETARPMIEQRRHELTVSLPPEPIWLHADAARLEQVLVNLLSNAAKYTDEGGQVWLTAELVSGTALAAGSSPGQSTLGHATTPAASAGPLTGSECVIRVRDSGIGITPDLLPHVFELFTQAERSLDRSQGGLGIGLALVLQLTELHGGKVEAFSELGHGSEFVVRLPVAPTDAPQSALSVSETGQPTTRPLRVLVVDDNVDTVASFKLLLQSLGHDVQKAHDGPAAVQAAIDYRPDVMLLDIGLPGLNGYEVAKRIRQQPDLKNVVLVALTGYGEEADRQTSLRAGFNQHLVKPARFDQLQQILATVSTQMT